MTARAQRLIQQAIDLLPDFEDGPAGTVEAALTEALGELRGEPPQVEPIQPSQGQHTPGPWSVAPFDELDKRISIVARGIEHAPLAWVDNDDVAPGEGGANARLIAASPQTFQALDPETLEAIADEIGTDFHHTARAASLRSIAARQRAAMKKAGVTP